MSTAKKNKLSQALKGAQKPKPDTTPEARPQVREAEGDYAMVPVSAIDPDPNQPRKTFTQEYIEGLAESLKLNKQRQAITLIRKADGRFQIKEGERRWRAAQIAGLDYLKAIIEDEKSEGLSPAEEAEKLRAQRAENTDREPLTVWEDIEACARYVELTGKSQKEAAKDLVISTSKLNKMLKIYKGPEPVQETVRLGVATNLNTVGSLIEMWEISQETAEAEVKKILTDGQLPERSEALYAQKARDMKASGSAGAATKQPKKAPKTSKGKPSEPSTTKPQGISDMKVVGEGVLQITDKSGQVQRYRVTKSWQKQWEALGEALFND